jgi:hypothetical protein
MDALVKPHFSISGLLRASAMVSPVPVSILLAFASLAHGSSEPTAASPMSFNDSEIIYSPQPVSLLQANDAPDQAVRRLNANNKQVRGIGLCSIGGVIYLCWK